MFLFIFSVLTLVDSFAKNQSVLKKYLFPSKINELQTREKKKSNATKQQKYWNGLRECGKKIYIVKKKSYWQNEWSIFCCCSFVLCSLNICLSDLICSTQLLCCFFHMKLNQHFEFHSLCSLVCAFLHFALIIGSTVIYLFFFLLFVSIFLFVLYLFWFLLCCRCSFFFWFFIFWFSSEKWTLPALSDKLVNAIWSDTFFICTVPTVTMPNVEVNKSKWDEAQRENKNIKSRADNLGQEDRLHFSCSLLFFSLFFFVHFVLLFISIVLTFVWLLWLFALAIFQYVLCLTPLISGYYPIIDQLHIWFFLYK